MDARLKNLKECMNNTVLKPGNMTNAEKRKIYSVAINDEVIKPRKYFAPLLSAVVLTGLFLSLGSIAYKNLLLSNQNSNEMQILALKENEQIKIENTIEGKKEVQNLMLNSIDNITTAFGSFRYYSGASKIDLVVNYQVDLSDYPKSYEKVEILSNGNGSTDSPDYELQVYNGEELMVGSGNTRTNEFKSTKVKVNKMTKSQREENQNSTMETRLLTIDGEKAAIKRMDPSYMGIAKTSLLPEDIAMGYLEDLSKWEIVGNEEVAGINSVLIKGTLGDYFSIKHGGRDFTLNIEPNTGILLKLEVKDSEGTVHFSVITSNIKINKILDETLFAINN